MIQDKAVNSLILFFNALQTYKGHANEGSQFEEIIRQLLRNYGFMQKQWDKTNDQIFNLSLKESTKKNIKKQIIEKNNIELIRNPDKNLAYIYIYQPFGSQNYPDFLVITEEWIIPIEIKFSTHSEDNHLPKWNSNIPKSNCIYIYSQVNKDIIYFLGSDFIGNDARVLLNNFFVDFNEEMATKLKVLKDKIISQNAKNNPFGIKPYIRKDYVYDKSFSSCPNEVVNGIYDYAKINHWKENLLHFLQELEFNDEE